MIEDKKLVPKFGNAQYVTEALDKAFLVLLKENIPLTEDQQTVIAFAVEAAYRNETDTWDHEIREGNMDPANARVAKLLHLALEL